MSILDKLKNGEKACISTIETESGDLNLYITPHNPEDSIEWSETISLLTDCYEFGSADATIEADLTHNIERDDGYVFRVITPPDQEVCEVGVVSILTDRGDDGEVIVPDEPYDKVHFRLSDGVYRLYEEKEFELI